MTHSYFQHTASQCPDPRTVRQIAGHVAPGLLKIVLSSNPGKPVAGGQLGKQIGDLLWFRHILLSLPSVRVPAA